MLMKLAGIGLTFLATIVLTRVLGAEQYGVYVFAFTLVGILSEPQFVGLRTLAVRNAAVYVDRGQSALLAGLAIRLRSVAIYGGIAAFGVLLIAGWLMGPKFGSGTLWVFVAGAALPFLLGYNRISDGMLRGAHLVMTSQFPKLIVRPALLLVYVAVGALLAGSAFNATWAMGMQVGAAATAAIVYVLLIRRHLGGHLKGAAPQFRTREWLHGMFPLMLSGVFQIIDTRAGVLMLGVLGVAADTGRFHATIRLAELIALVQAVANIVVEPWIARYCASGELDKLQRKVTTAARLVFFATLPVSLLVIWQGAAVLAIFGPEFVAAAPALTILAIAQVVKAALGTLAPLLNMAGYPRETVVGMAIGLAAHIVLGVLLIPKLGLVGAAWAALISMLVWKIYLMFRVHRLLGLYTTALGPLVNPGNWTLRK